MQGSNSEIVLPDLYEATISEIQDGLESGRFKSTHLVKVCWVSFLCISQDRKSVV